MSVQIDKYTFFKAKELLHYCSEEEMYTHKLLLYLNLLLMFSYCIQIQMSVCNFFFSLISDLAGTYETCY